MSNETRKNIGVNKSMCESLQNDLCFQLEFGVIYSCLEDKMYKARRGKGAFCDDDPIQVSDVKGNAITVIM